MLFCLASCKDTKQNDPKPLTPVEQTQQKLVGKWNYVSQDVKFYEKGSSTVYSSKTYSYKEGDYLDILAKEMKDYRSNALLITVTYQVIDASHIQETYNGTVNPLIEIRELTDNSLVVYRESIDNDQRRFTYLTTFKR